MTEISNSQFFSNSNSGFDMWKTTSSGALWEQPTTTTTPTPTNNISSTSNPLKSSSGSFILKSTPSSTITSPTSTSVNVNGVSTTTSPTHPPLLHTTSYSQLQVPSSIKNSQFINITSSLGTSSTTGAGGVDNSNWLSHSDSFVQPPLKRGLVKAYSDADIQPPLSIQQQIQQAQAQQAQQDLENEQEDIEDEITGQNRYKTELCRSFQETGVCRYGLKCQFAHGRDELRNVMRHPKYKTETCKTFYSIGSCPYGSRCRFIHTRDPEHSITLGMSQLSCSNGNVSPPSNSSSNSSNNSNNSSSNSNNNIINGNIIYSNTPASFASEVLLSKALPQMIRQHSSPQLQTPLYILQQQKELQQQQKDHLKEQLREQKELQFKEKEQQQYNININNSKESPIKQQIQPQQQQPHPTTVHWSNSWSSDEASSTAPNSNFNQLKSSAPPILKKEDSSKRLAIFKTICSNSTW